MLKNAYLLAKIGADTAKNERIFAENLPKLATTPRGSAGARGTGGRSASGSSAPSACGPAASGARASPSGAPGRLGENSIEN